MKTIHNYINERLKITSKIRKHDDLITTTVVDFFIWMFNGNLPDPNTEGFWSHGVKNIKFANYDELESHFNNLDQIVKFLRDHEGEIYVYEDIKQKDVVHYTLYVKDIKFVVPAYIDNESELFSNNQYKE